MPDPNAPGRVRPKPHAMDWYYPVPGSVLTGHKADQRLAADLDRFAVPD
jgi:hypothetical protein